MAMTMSMSRDMMLDDALRCVDADHLAAHPGDATKIAKPAVYQVGPDHAEYTYVRRERRVACTLDADSTAARIHMLPFRCGHGWMAMLC